MQADQSPLADLPGDETQPALQPGDFDLSKAQSASAPEQSETKPDAYQEQPAGQTASKPVQEPVADELPILHAQPPVTHRSTKSYTPDVSPSRTPPSPAASGSNGISSAGIQEALLQAPIKVQNQSLGILELIDDDPGRVWSHQEKRLVEEVLDQLSLALENAELFQQTQDALSETEKLYQISADFNAAGTLEDLLTSIAVPNEAGDQPFAVILWQFELDELNIPEWMTFTNHWTAPGKTLNTPVGARIYLPDYPGGQSLIANPIAPVFCDDTSRDQINEGTRQLLLANNTSGAAILPLALRGRWIGQVTIFWEAPTRFGERDEQRYRSLAAQAAVAVNNRLLFEQTERRARQLEWLSLIKDTLSQAVDEAGILSATSMALDLSTPPLWIAMLYTDTDAFGSVQRAKTAAFWRDGIILEAIPNWDTNRFLDTLKSLRIFELLPDNPFFIEDVQSDSRSSDLLEELALDMDFRAFCVLPLFSSGRWQGALAFAWPVLYQLSDNEHFYLKELLEPVAAFIASRRSYLAEQEARQAMERRNLQLQTAALVSRAASSILDPDVLVKDTVEIVQKRFDLYYVGLFLVDETGEITREPRKWAVLRAGTGEAGKTMLGRGHRLEIDGPSMIGHCIATNRAQIWRGDEADLTLRYRNPVLPDTRSEMALPLVSRGEVIGAMTFQSTRPGDFTEADISVLQTMADQVANSIQNARLFGRTQDALSETERLYQASAALNIANTYRDILEMLVQHAPLLEGFGALNLHFFDRLWTDFIKPNRSIMAVHLPDADTRPTHTGLHIDSFPGVSRYLRHSSPAVFENLTSEAVAEDTGLARFYLQRYTAGSAIILPLVAAGQGIGFIEVLFSKPTRFAEAELKKLGALSAQAAVAFQNLHNIELADQRAREAQERSQELALVNRVVGSVSAHTDLKSALIQVAHDLGKSLNVQVGIALMNEYRSGLVIMAEHFLNEDGQSAIGMTIPIMNNPSTQQVLETRQPLIIPDATSHPSTAYLHEALAERGVETLNIFPMIAGNEVIGTIGLDILEKGRTLSDNEIRLAETIIIQAATAIQNVRLFEQTQAALAESESLYQANTELNNAQAYEHVLDILRRYTILGEGVASAFICLFDRTWTDELSPDWYIPVARWSRTSEFRTEKQRFALKEWGTADQILHPNFPTFITDVHNDPRMDQAARSIFRDSDRSAGMLFAPLNVAGNWIGHIHAYYQRPLDFSEAELRRLTTLAGQAAVVVQNIRSAELTRQRALQLEKLASIQAVLSQAGNEREILSALILPAEPDDPPGSISMEYISTNGNSEPEWIELVALWEAGVISNLVEKQRSSASSDPLASLWLAHPDEVLFIPDVQTHPALDPGLQTTLLSKGCHALAVIPLRSGGSWQGLVTYTWQHPHEFSQDDHFLLRRLLESTSEVVARRRAFIAQQHARQESDRRAVQLQTAAEIARETTGTLSLSELLTRAVTLMSNRYGYYHASIYLVDEASKFAQVRASAGAASEALLAQELLVPVGSASMIGLVTKTGEMVLANNLRGDPGFQPNPLLPSTGSELTIPMKIGDKVIGVVDVQSEQSEAFDAEDASVLQVLADQLAVAVDNARTYELANQAFQQARQRAQEMTLLFNVSQSLASAPLESEEIASIVTEQFARVLEVPECTLAILQKDGSTSNLFALGAYGVVDRSPRLRIGLPVALPEEPASQKAVETLLPVVANAGDDTLNKEMLAHLRKHGIQTLLAIPLAVKGEAIGVIELVSHQWPRYYSADQLNLAMTLANAAAVAIENAQLYEEQQRTAQRLLELDQLKTQFLANMSHELRTPLNSIIGFSRVILKGIDGPVTDLQQQDLSAIYNSGQHLLSLINNILDLSKIEAGKMELALEDVDLADMINSVLSTSTGLTKEKPIEIKRSVEPDLPIVHVDRTRIRQVLINLVSNAAKFTEEGTITISARRQTSLNGQREVWIGVTNSGPGIAFEDQDKLFKAFSQVDASPTRKTGGTGLGLSISRHLVEMHGGNIGVESTPGKGSTFFFTLPLQVDEKEETVFVEPTGDGPVILSIDDNRQVISLYERYLGSHQYRVVPVTDPEQALAVARELQPFAITLDIMMPGRDGWSILQQIKQDPETRHIPVIICSILEDQEKGFSLGAADYLVKPILEEDLVQSVRRLNLDDSLHTILVVDDDEADLRLVKKILDQEGRFEVLTALGGQEALLVLEKELPHAIILDLYMPGLDGFSLIETVRANPHLRNIPVIIFTGGDLEEEQRRKLLSAGQELLQKSLFTEQELLTTIESCLERFAIQGSWSPAGD